MYGNNRGENMEKTEEKFSGKMKEIDLISLLKFLVRNIWIILLIGILLGAASYGYTVLAIAPTYRSTFTAYVNNNSQTVRTDTSLTNADLIASQQLVKTYSHIITSKTILLASANAIGLDMSYEELLGMIVITQDEGTEIIRVSVIATSKDLAYKLNQAIAKTAPVYVEQIVEGSSMRIVDESDYPKRKFGPNTTRRTMLGIGAGILLAMFFVMLRYFTDDTVKSEKEVEEHFPYPVVGIIPDIESGGKSYDSYRYGYSDRSHTAKRRKKSNGK